MVARPFKCPFCKRVHMVDEHDFDEGMVECPDNQISEIKETKGRIPSDILSRRAWNMNRFDLRENNYSGVNVAPELENQRTVGDKSKSIRNW